MKNLKSASPDFAALDKAVESLLRSLATLSSVTAESTLKSKGEPLTAINARASTDSKETTMNTLTANRILQKGDQYLLKATNTEAGAKWTEVPKEEWGLQIMFSKFKGFELRRPTEKPSNPDAIWPNPQTISPKVEGVRSDQPSEAENGNTPAPIRSGAGGTATYDHTGNAPFPPKPKIRLPKRLANPAVTPLIEHDKDTCVCRECVRYRTMRIGGLPTVISRRAHIEKSIAEVGKEIAEEIKRKGEELEEEIRRRAAEEAEATGFSGYKATPTPPVVTAVIKFTKGASITKPRWLGRNGQFNGYGLDIFRSEHDKIMLTPIGKRGAGRCLIEIPVTDIDNFIKALRKLVPATLHYK
jgi:hypothetical protein